MTTKTYDPQTGKFLARVAENMPQISRAVMQRWIDDPHALKRHLSTLASPFARLPDEQRMRRLTHVSNGMSGDQWLTHLDAKCVHVKDCARLILRSSGFVPRMKNAIREIVIVGWDSFAGYSGGHKNVEDMCKFAGRYGLTHAEPEDACLVCDGLLQEGATNMGFEEIMVIHKPIKDVCSDENSRLSVKAYRGIDLHFSPVSYGHQIGFAFAAVDLDID